MQQLELFDFRRDVLFEKDNQIAHFYDVLSETKDGISYAEHIDPKKNFLYVVWIMKSMLMFKRNT